MGIIIIIPINIFYYSIQISDHILENLYLFLKGVNIGMLLKE